MPTWSPDGRRIAFANDGQIYLMNSDGSNLVRLAEGALATAPAWSPDGRTIAYSRLHDGQFGICLVRADVDSSLPTLVGHPRGWNAHPAWSPDGSKIAFVSDWRAFDIVYDLYVMNADGSGLRSLLEGPFFWEDGLTFYFRRPGRPMGGE